MAEITYQMILSTLQTVGLLVGIFYYVTTLRNAQKTRELTLQSQELTRKAQEQTAETRQTQLFMQIYQHSNSEDSYKSWAELVNLGKIDYEEYLQNYDSTVNPVHFGKRSTLWYNYNTIGELLRLNVVETDLLHRLNFDIMVIVMWETWEHIIRKNRVKESMPDLWEGFEYLYNEMKTLRDNKNYPDITFNQ